MSATTVIALRRIKRSARQYLILVFTIIVSTALISAFLLIYAEIDFYFTRDSYLSGLPFTDFLYNFKSCLGKASALLSVVTAFVLHSHLRMRRDDHSKTFLTLSSIGATSHQKNQLLITEMFLLYFPASFLGIFIGLLCSNFIVDMFLKSLSVSKTSDDAILIISTAIALLIVIFVFIMICCLLPGFNLKKNTILRLGKNEEIPRIKNHSYRNSKTFKGMAFVKRLAHKSTEYYSKYYRKISFSFVMSVAYPTIAILLFIYMSKVGVVVDTNPYDGIDTSEAVLLVVDSLLAFASVGFLFLALMSVIQTVFIIKSQMERRSSALKIYNSIGMNHSDCRRLIMYEFQRVVLGALVCSAFVFVFINFVFQF